MKTEKLTVETSIFEQEDYLLKRIDKAILNKEKLHITAPVGTHKTTLAMELIEMYPEYQFVFLFPQKSISSQVYNKIPEEGTPAYVYNSTTKTELENWEVRNGKDWPYTYLSTIDSAHRLFEKNKLDPEKTVVIIDETHAFLQNPRKDFDPTAYAIKEAGCPVIGFTATESNWVLEYVLGIDEKIKIEATDLPNKDIVPIKVGRGMPSAIAELIEERGGGKTVIWTEVIDDQNNFEQELKNKFPLKKVVVLNTKRRDSSEASTWAYLMENDEIPPDIDIIIINSVAQAGININNKDIETVLLVGKFDPLGFMQYLGRCRKYKGYYYFLHHTYGKQTSLWPGADKMEAYLTHVEKVLDNFSEEEFESLSDINPMFAEYYTQLPTGKLALKKCMVANLAYKTFREVNGAEMLEFVGEIDPNLVIGDDMQRSGTPTQNAAAQKAANRKGMKAKLPKLIKKYARYLSSMIDFYEEGMTHDDLLKLIAGASTKRMGASTLYVPRTYKKGLSEAVTTAKNAGVSVKHLLLAGKKYLDNGKSEDTLKALLDMSDKKVNKHIDAYYFFRDDFQNNSTISGLLDDYSDRVGERKMEKEWLSDITGKLPNIPRLGLVAKRVYDCCFITKPAKKPVNGVRKSRRELVQVVRTFDDYKSGNSLDEIF